MKNARHSEILRLIREQKISTQEELAEELKKSGFTVTQATISRDIRQLRIRKIPDADGGQRYSEAPDPESTPAGRFRRVLRDAYVSMDSSFNIIVIHTVSGMAMAAAAALDSMDWPELCGCIAGDDTVFCAIRDPKDAAKVMNRIRLVVREHD